MSGLILGPAFIAVGDGVFRTLSYTLPMLTHDYPTAAQSKSGDPALAWYDAGLSIYQAGDYEDAQKVLTKGYTLLSDKDGNIPQSRQQLAADFQLLIGNSLFYQQKFNPAAEAYKQALRHSPNDMEAKYNLEMIEMMIASGSGKGGDPKGPAGQAGKGAPKGI